MLDAIGSGDAASEDPAEHSPLAEFNQTCLKAFIVQDNEVYDTVQTKLRCLLEPQSPEAIAAENESVLANFENLLAEVSGLETVASEDDIASLVDLRADPPGLTTENLERQAQLWWQNTTEQLEQQIADHSTATGKAFMVNLCVALAKRDSEAAPQVVEMLRPLQQAVEQYIQDDLRTCASTAGTKLMRATLREGSGAVVLQLEAAVNSAVIKAKEWWSDERIIKAAERQRASTEVTALIAPASQDSITAIHGLRFRAGAAVIPPLPSDPTPEAGAGVSPNTSGETASLTSSLLARVREGTRLLDADLEVLASDAAGLKQALERCGEVVGKFESGGSGADGGNAEQSAAASSAALASTRAELERLIKDAKFEEAFEQALRWDEQTQGHVTEQLCDEVFKATGSHTPEEFLTVEGCHRLHSDRLRLLLMSNLCQRITAEGTSAKQAESNLEWVLCLQGQFEFNPSVSKTFALVAGAMVDCLSDVSQGRSPPSLLVAVSEDRQRVATNARLALKQVKMFQRRSSTKVGAQ